MLQSWRFSPLNNSPGGGTGGRWWRGMWPDPARLIRAERELDPNNNNNNNSYNPSHPIQPWFSLLGKQGKNTGLETSSGPSNIFLATLQSLGITDYCGARYLEIMLHVKLRQLRDVGIRKLET